MAFSDTDKVWQMIGLTAVQKHVLGCLAWHRNGDKKSPYYNQCNPSFDLLVKETGLGQGSLSRSILKLESTGSLIVERDPLKRKTNRYYFPWNQSSIVEDKSSTKEPNKDSEFHQGTQSSPMEPQSSTVIPQSSTVEIDIPPTLMETDIVNPKNESLTGKLTGNSNRELNREQHSAASGCELQTNQAHVSINDMVEKVF